MIDDPALGLDAAVARARVSALLVQTSAIRRALGTREALGSAVRRTSYVLRTAGADSLLFVDATLAVGSAGRWIAGVSRQTRVTCFI